MLRAGGSEGNVTTRDPWRHYVEAMQRHRAADERLFDRLRFIIGDGISQPGRLDQLETDTWRALVSAAEEAATLHRTALEQFLSSVEHASRR